GTIVFTGATASVRGGDGFAAFAGAKQGPPAFSQSMGGGFGRHGGDVPHVVMDGAWDTARIAENFPGRYARQDKAGLCDPAAVAEMYWQVHCQPRNAWTHELDLRPWMEPW